MSIMRKFRILLVDDNEALRFGFARYLEHKDFIVREAGTLTSARNLISCEAFDALILDLDLPDGDGTELLTDTKASDPHFPILVVSGSSRHAATECSSLGADGYLCKPISVQVLHSSLINLLKK
jgi:DNA-binding response OmpR family regulator